MIFGNAVFIPIADDRSLCAWGALSYTVNPLWQLAWTRFALIQGLHNGLW